MIKETYQILNKLHKKKKIVIESKLYLYVFENYILEKLFIRIYNTYL